MKFTSFDDKLENYPIVLIPPKVAEFQNSKLDNIKIAEFLGKSYPILDLNIYRINEFHKTKIQINEIDFLNPNKDNYSSALTDYFLGTYKLPRKPSKFEHKEESNTGCIVGIVLFVVSTILIAIFLKIFVAIVYFLLVSFIAIIIIGSKSENDKIELIPINESEFKKKHAKFLSEYLEIKTTEQSRFETLKKEIDEHINTNKEKILKEILLDNLKPLVTIRKITHSNTRGKAELFFLTKLYEKYNNQIYFDVIPNIGKNPFKPDFVLICKETGFHIDIEIDEPYSVEKGIPIHHDRSNDSERNQFFNEINWGVIRFSERQIIENSDECLCLIDNVLDAIKNKNNSFEHKVPIHKKWTYEEALIMSNGGFRNSYLPHNMKIRVNYNSDNKSFEIDDLPF